MSKKAALIYYSYSGNIRSISEMMKEIVDIDVFELKPLKAYPQNINDLIPIAKDEIDNKLGRSYHTIDIDVKKYETLFLATPNWGDTLAPPLLTFIRESDLKNINIVPIITHQGTGKGRVIEDIEKETGTKINDLFVDYHKRTDKDQLRAWLMGLEVNLL